MGHRAAWETPCASCRIDKLTRLARPWGSPSTAEASGIRAGWASAGGALQVEVALAAVAVVADVEGPAVCEVADRAVGLLVGDLDPEGGAPRAGVAVVELDRFRVVGEGCDDSA